MNHFELVAQKFKPAQATANDMHKVTGYEAQFIHASMGLIGEWLELEIADPSDVENLKEELGDILFFYRALAMVTGYPTVAAEHCTCTEDMGKLYIGISERINALFDIGKKTLCYAKPMPTDSAIHELLNGLDAMLYKFIKLHGFTVTEIEELNDAKLNKRYSKGFSNAEAQQRADKKEGE